jgi:hypothetical protein
MKFLANESNKEDNSTNLIWKKSEFPNEKSLPSIW